MSNSPLSTPNQQENELNWYKQTNRHRFWKATKQRMNRIIRTFNHQHHYLIPMNSSVFRKGGTNLGKTKNRTNDRKIHGIPCIQQQKINYHPSIEPCHACSTTSGRLHLKIDRAQKHTQWTNQDVMLQINTGSKICQIPAFNSPGRQQQAGGTG